MTQEQKAEAQRMRDEGASYQSIGACLGVSARVVTDGLNPEHASAMNKRYRAKKQAWENAKRARLIQARKEAWLARHESFLREGSLPIYRKDEVVGYTLLDREDWERYRTAKLVWAGPGYAGMGPQKYLHRMLMGLGIGDSMWVDHINRNKLDNRRSNLRVVTPAQSAQNRVYEKSRSCVRQTSAYRFTAKTMLNGHVHRLGSYPTFDEAAKVVAEWKAENMPFAPALDDRSIS